MTPRIVLALSLLLGACAPMAPRRAAIVPLVDHHAHMVGPTAVLLPPASLPAIELPAPLDRLLQERNGIMGKSEIGDLYVEDPRLVETMAEGHPWVHGRDAAARIVSGYDAGARFVPTAFDASDAVGYIAGMVQHGDPSRTTMNFFLGLENVGGTWRIAVEEASPIPARTFDEPLTAERLVRDLDVAGIERAVVLSVAYWFASPNRRWPGDEYANVRAENDWVAAQVARYPNRLVAFCGVSPLKDYAIEEIRRCKSELGMRGVKMHFRSSRVDVTNPEHLEKVRKVFAAINGLGMAMVIHTRPSGDYGRRHAEIFLNELLPMAPEVPVQIAHLWGGNEFNAEALGVFADAVSSGDRRAKNLYFDLTEIEFAAGESPQDMQTIAARLRQIGLKRVFFGSDAPTTPEGPAQVERWGRLRLRLPLTDAEMQVIASNVAPYLR